ncbi:3-ketoacyl-ACP reductase [Castellaniella sp.]|uniref:3-ketoacyl-ACP reductase n=1 Tax=Castellaniella sp. TaxID=1955812 RepID=UPI00355D6A35
MTTLTENRRVAIVTGARRGIGRAIAYGLASAGFDLVLNDIVQDEAGAATLDGVRSRGARVEFVHADVADLGSHPHIVEQAYRAFGRLDCLVNNAGVQVRKRGDLLEVTPERFDEILGVNLRGNFFLTQLAARRMLADEAAGRHRSIVVLSSSNAHLVSVEKGEYCISKTGLSMMTKLFAVRLAEAGIMVYEIQPGLIRTDMTAEVREKYGRIIDEGASPVRRWGEPEDIGQTVVSLATGAIPFATGISLGIDGGLMIPRL